jgi:hypothetical protein
MSPNLRKIKTALVPIGIGDLEQAALSLAKAIAEEVTLVGIVPIMGGASLSGGAQAARQLRKRLFALSDQSTHYKSTIIVSEAPWIDLNKIIAQETPDLLVLERRDEGVSCGIPLASALSNSLCDLAIVRGASPFQFNRVLVAVRGGPNAELAFRISMGLQFAQTEVLHLTLKGAVNDAPFKGLKSILDQMPEINLRTVTTDDVARSILEESKNYDLVIMGVTAGQTRDQSTIGPVAKKLLFDSPATVMIVKTCRSIPEEMFDETAGVNAISILVDKWFAETLSMQMNFLI